MPYTDQGYARFSDAEYARRHDAARGLLEKSGTDALVLYGTSSQSGTGQADIYYLSQHTGKQENILLFFPDQDPVLLVTAFNHVPNARRQSVIADVRHGGAKPDFGHMIATVLKEKGVSPKRLGMVGFLPWSAYNQLRSDLPDTEYVNLLNDFRLLRLKKSDEELEWLREGCDRTDKAMMAMVDGMRAGMKEFELGFLLADGYRDVGGEDYLHYTSSTPMDNPNRAVPSQTPSNRVIQSGDIFSIELSIGYHGYAGQALRTITLDAEPTKQFQDLYDTADEAYRRMAETIKPGATTADVLQEMKFIDDRGYAIIDGLLHGYGIGILPPSLPGEGYFLTETRPVIADEAHKPFTFEEGMTLVLQPNISNKEGTAGVQLGNFGRITANGFEALHNCPLELLRATS